jgi:lipopolysaccharide export system protein LptA
MNATYFAPNDTVKVKSDKAFLDKSNMNVTLKDNVTIVNKDGATLTTDSLDWQKKQNRISTTDPVQIKKQDMQIKADGLEGDTQLRKIDFQKNVEAQLNMPDEKGFVVITCDGVLEIEYNKGQAVFNKNVVVKHEQGTLYSDKATAYFDAKEKTISKIVCDGHVKIVKDENASFAEKATYLRQEGRIVMEGRPRLVYYPQDNNTGEDGKDGKTKKGFPF